MSDSATPWTVALQASPSFIISQGLLKLMSIELMMLSDHLILHRLLLLLPSIFPRISVLPNEMAGQSLRAVASASVLPIQC